MVIQRAAQRFALSFLVLAGLVNVCRAQAGAIRGQVRDKDFGGAPLPGVEVTLNGSQRTTTGDQGNYLFVDVPPGTHTLVFAKPGFVTQVRPGDVAVFEGRPTEVDIELVGDFTDMEEFVVEEGLQLTPGSEASLLQLRFESPALMDSVSSDLMNRAGASDAAGAMRLIAGATVQNNKSAVIRGLPDRYVSSQMNGVRLPTADSDKRAVELDQFPTTVIESIQVSKTFTPDQQGDASGGAVDLRLKGIPEDVALQFRSQYGYNTQVTGQNDFLTYRGGGLTYFGRDDGRRGQQLRNLGGNWDGAVGTTTDDAPIDYKWSLAGGGKREFEDGVKVGGYLNFFYKRDSSFYDDGKDDSYWVEDPGGPMVPRSTQGTPQGGDFRTSLFDITQGKRSVQWGGLGTFGIETELHKVNFAYLYTRTTEDVATLAEDTRGKEYYFPGHDPYDPNTPGHEEPDAAPYIRTETLKYTERTTSTLQLTGEHKLPLGEGFGPFGTPELTWTVSRSSADSNQPDKRQFGEVWFPARSIGPFVIPANHRPFKPAANFNLGNLQRIWQEVHEDSAQYSLGMKVPFESFTKKDAWFKVGFFRDDLDRTFNQDTFSNFNDNSFYEAPFENYWSRNFANENHPITESLFDVDYQGNQKILAWYSMASLPVFDWLTVVGGVRFESTDISIANDPERDATWFPPGATAPVALNPGDADVSFRKRNALPAFAVEVKPNEELTFRAAYTETVARQTFKELTPILQQEFLGGPIFIGNPELQMSSLKNYDLRADWVPYEGSLFSVSWFRKDISDAIEYIQRLAGFDFTSPVNYPRGRLTGIELELRQSLGHFSDDLEGLSVGANATFIQSRVYLPKEERAGFNDPGIAAPLKSRDMTGTPEYLYNLYMTYELADLGTQFGLFYTVQGDTLAAGAGQANGNFVPNLYAKEFDSLNLSIGQRLGDHFRLQFQAKNLTNPSIDTVYRSRYIGKDVRRASFQRGIDLSIALTAEFRF
ncbi:MAG: carboxypeptidase regulatory-like domain-containing protein [Planctomycetes bacterium]|nr:carboxypeptidase regulatory-like domain-containing protein [Planctomycetota bacterium]